MTIQRSNAGDRSAAWQWVGGLLLAHFAVVVTIKCVQGRAPEVLWMSHLCLGLTAIALLAGRDRLARIAMTAITIPNLLWLADAAALLLTDRSPLGITAYLADATTADWVATAHHFYLLPLLAWTLYRKAGWDVADTLGAGSLIAFGFAAGRIASSPAQNVNYSHGLLGALRHPVLDWINTAPPAGFAAAYLAIIAMLVVLPGSAVVYAVTRLHPGAQADSRANKSAPTPVC